VNTLLEEAISINQGTFNLSQSLLRSENISGSSVEVEEEREEIK
jgi:hypothetical protein